MLMSLLQSFVPEQITILLYMFSVRAKLLATSFILAPGSDVTCVLASLVWFIPLRRDQFGLVYSSERESPITRSGFCA